MTSRSAWRGYVEAERRYLDALEALLAADYGPQVRAALEGRSPDGPPGFRTAVHLLTSLPPAWLNENIDVLIELMLDGGEEWFTIRPLLDTVDAGRLDAQLRQVVAGLEPGSGATVGDFEAAVSLLESLARRELVADVLDKARSSENHEIRAIAE